VAERVVIVARGKVGAEGTPGALRGAGTIRVVVPPDEVERAAAALGADGEIIDAPLGRLRARAAAEEVARRLVAAGCALRELAPEEKSLEEVFLELTR
jgi:ABC-type multidrug transport system ATPase subunit